MILLRAAFGALALVAALGPSVAAADGVDLSNQRQAYVIASSNLDGELLFLGAIERTDASGPSTAVDLSGAVGGCQRTGGRTEATLNTIDDSQAEVSVGPTVATVRGPVRVAVEERRWETCDYDGAQPVRTFDLTVQVDATWVPDTGVPSVNPPGAFLPDLSALPCGVLRAGLGADTFTLGRSSGRITGLPEAGQRTWSNTQAAFTTSSSAVATADAC